VGVAVVKRPPDSAGGSTHRKRYIALETKYNALRDASGAVLRLLRDMESVGVSEDISDRIQAELAAQVARDD
jgi:hypothetical protein